MYSIRLMTHRQKHAVYLTVAAIVMIMGYILWLVSRAT